MKRKRRGRIGHVIPPPPPQKIEFPLTTCVLFFKKKYILPLA